MSKIIKPIEKTDLSKMTGRDEIDNTYMQVIDDDKPSDEISMKAITELLDLKKLKTISRLKFDQIQVITKLYLFSETFGDKFTSSLADLILQLQISTNGLGRKELVQLVQQRSDIMEMMTPKKKEIFK